MRSKFEKFINQDSSGFTVVEIIVVVLIIGILATILILTYSGIQQRQHNSTRIADIKLIQSNLETEYAQSGVYPTLAEINSTTWRKANFKNLDINSMIDPSNKSSSPTFTATPTKNYYSYQVTASNGVSPCDNKTVACGKYVLTATLEGGSGTFIEKSLN